MEGIEKITAKILSDAQADIDQLNAQTQEKADAIARQAQAQADKETADILAKKPDDWSKGMVLCITVEFYAILSLLASMLMIINISG